MDGGPAAFQPPALEVERTGWGGQNRTLLVNVEDVALAMGRPTQYLVHFLSRLLGAACRFQFRGDPGWCVDGHHSGGDLRAMLAEFSQTYVLCGSCQASETHLDAGAGVPVLVCRCCGRRHELKTDEFRFRRFEAKLLQFPMSRLARPLTLSGLTSVVLVGQRLVGTLMSGNTVLDLAVEAGQVDSFRALRDHIAAALQLEPGRLALFRNGERVVDDRVAVTWDSDTIVMKEEVRWKSFAEAKNDTDGPEVQVAIASMSESVASKPCKDTRRELKNVGVQSGFERRVVLYILLEAIFLRFAMDSKVLHRHRKLVEYVIRKMGRSSEDVLWAFGISLQGRPGARKSFPVICKVLYDEDWVTEHAWLSYFGPGSPRLGDPGFAEARQAAEPFLEWLRTTDSGSSSHSTEVAEGGGSSSSSSTE